MQKSNRDAVAEYLRGLKQPVTRAQIAAALPDRPVNAINRMVRDMVKRGTVKESSEGLLTLNTTGGRMAIRNGGEQ
jgi:hypothetical protein